MDWILARNNLASWCDMAGMEYALLLRIGAEKGGELDSALLAAYAQLEGALMYAEAIVTKVIRLEEESKRAGDGQGEGKGVEQ